MDGEVMTTLEENYNATQHLLAIREEQVGELLKEIKELRDTLRKAPVPLGENDGDVAIRYRKWYYSERIDKK
jgi:hypothetical protein